MNTPVFITACISLLALIAHTFIGTKESILLSPSSTTNNGGQENQKLVQYWKQSMCAFQMLTVDLLLMTIVLFIIAITEWIPFEYELILFLSLVFFLWGTVWLIQLFWLNTKTRTYLHLGQWIFWFICSALLIWGSTIPMMI